MIAALVTLITSVCNLLLGLLVLVRNPKHVIHRSFFIITVSIIAWIITIYFYYIVTDPRLLLIIGRLNFSTVPIIAYSFYLFSYVFPEIINTRYKKIVFSIGIVSVVLAVLAYVTPFVSKNELIVGGERETIYGSLYVPYMLYFVGLLLAGITIQIRKLKYFKGVQKQQIRLLFFGFVLMFGLVTITNAILPYLFGIYDLQQISPLISSIYITISAIVILKYKLLDIKLLTTKVVVYVLTLSFFGGIYALFLFVIGSIFTNSQQSSSTIIQSTVVALFFLVSFQPVRRWFERLTNRIFDKYSYITDEVLLELTHEISSTLDLEIILQKVLELLQKRLYITVTLAVIHQSFTDYIVVHRPNTIPSFILEEEQLFELGKHEKILVFDNMPESPVKQLMRKKNISIFIPLETSRNIVGYLMCGPKSSGEIYSSQDIRLLEILAPEFAVGIENAKSYEEIKQFNITLQKEIEKATKNLREANRHLKDLDKMKDEFLSIASHDLRTPMTAMKGYLYLMLKRIDEMPPGTGEQLKKIYNSSERLIALINDILDVSRIESGRMKYLPEKFSLNTLVHDVILEMKTIAEERQIELREVGKENIDVFMDKNKFHEVLINLVGNALKFTGEHGSVTIDFRKEEQSVVIRVIDTGIGIDSKDISKLFTKFVRIDTSKSERPQVSGTGLGLYICKKIMDMSDGSISVTSKVGKGSTFICSIPLLIKSKKKSTKN